MRTKNYRQYQQDAERIAQNLSYQNPDVMKYLGTPNFDQAFDQAWNHYFTGADHAPGNETKQLTKKEINKFPQLFKAAGGKNLKQDLTKRHKTIVDDKQQYKELGAQQADKKGLDVTKASKPKKALKVRPTHQYPRPGRQKNTKTGIIKIVYARQLSTKAGIRWISKAGTYVQIKK
jgi:hypothetical protein